MNTRYFMRRFGHCGALIFLAACLAGFFLRLNRLRSIPDNLPEHLLTDLSLTYLIPMSMIVCVLLFETWACVRSGAPNPWPVVVLTYISIATSSTIILFACTSIEDIQQMLIFRRSFAGPLRVALFTCLLAIILFYAIHIARQCKHMPLALSIGRWITYIWVVYFSLSRLWLPVQTINRILMWVQ